MRSRRSRRSRRSQKLSHTQTSIPCGTLNNKKVISTFNFGYPCLTLKEGPRSNPTAPKGSQLMISYTLVYHPKPLGLIISELEALLTLPILHEGGVQGQI